eukprot:scaffold4226_cov180-Amphora_coffeaeformis.AAC.9
MGVLFLESVPAVAVPILRGLGGLFLLLLLSSLLLLLYPSKKKLVYHARKIQFECARRYRRSTGINGHTGTTAAATTTRVAAPRGSALGRLFRSRRGRATEHTVTILRLAVVDLVLMYYLSLVR